ncbi:MAG: PAS domain S-box protein, partial [Thermodesulfovibrionales bacterium]
MNDTDSHLLSLIDSLPMPMALVDENGAVRFLNRKFEETFGYTPEDLPTLDDWHRKACSDPDYRQKTFERWSFEVERAKGGEYMRPFELTVRCKNGEERQVELLGSVREGNILAVFHDLTERKLAEEKVKAGELRYRSIFDLSPAGIGLATREGEIIAVNSAMQEIFGYSLEELTEKNVSDLYLSPVDRVALLQILDSQGVVRDLAVNLRRKDGTVFDALLNISLVNCNGRSCLQTICIDITERQKAEEL